MEKSAKAKMLLQKAPFISEKEIGSELFKKFIALIGNIKDNKNLLGIWYFTELKFDEGYPQILVKSNYDKSSIDYLLLCTQIHDYIEQDVAFHYSALEKDGFLIGQKEEILQEILSGKILTVFNRERD